MGSRHRAFLHFHFFSLLYTIPFWNSAPFALSHSLYMELRLFILTTSSGRLFSARSVLSQIHSAHYNILYTCISFHSLVLVAYTSLSLHTINIFSGVRFMLYIWDSWSVHFLSSGLSSFSLCSLHFLSFLSFLSVSIGHSPVSLFL